MPPPSHTAIVTWSDPTLLYAAHAGLPSIDLFRAMMAGNAPLEPAIALIGAEITSVEPGLVVMDFTPGERHLDHRGNLHSGILAVLTDTAAGYAVHTRMPTGGRYASVELHLDVVAPIPVAVGRIVVTGRTLRMGARTANCEARVTDAGGVLHALMTMTMIVLPSERS